MSIGGRGNLPTGRQIRDNNNDIIRIILIFAFCFLNFDFNLWIY